MLKNLLFLVFACLITAAFVCEADNAEEGSWGNLNQLKSDQKLEVVEVNLKSYKGKYVTYSQEGITLRVPKEQASEGMSKEEDITVRRSDVLRVSAVQTNRLRDTMVGAAAGVAIGAAYSLTRTEANCDCTRGQFFLIIGLPVFGGIGAAVGAIIPHHVYQIVYRNPAPTEAK